MMRRFLVCVTETKIGIYRLSEDFPILETSRDIGTILFFSIHTEDSKEEIQSKLQLVTFVNPFTQNGIASGELTLEFLKGASIDGNDIYFTVPVLSLKSNFPKGYNIHYVED